MVKRPKRGSLSFSREEEAEKELRKQEAELEEEVW